MSSKIQALKRRITTIQLSSTPPRPTKPLTTEPSPLGKVGTWFGRIFTPEKSEKPTEKQDEKPLISAWEKLLAEESTDRKKIIKLCRKGIPDVMRKEAWRFLIGDRYGLTPDIFESSTTISREKYTEYLDERSLGGRDHPAQSPFQVIEADVPRTFGSSRLFQAECPLHESLTTLLQRYTAFSPDLGYVQGMSYPAALLTLHLEEYDAFTCFVSLLEDTFLRSLYSMNLKLIVVHLQVYDLLFENELPALFAHFKNEQVAPDQYLLGWLMTLFGKTVPLGVACRIMDNFAVEGEIFLYVTSLAILKIHELELLSKPFEEIVMRFRDLGNNVNEHVLFDVISTIKIPDEVEEFLDSIPKVKSFATNL